MKTLSGKKSQRPHPHPGCHSGPAVNGRHALPGLLGYAAKLLGHCRVEELLAGPLPKFRHD